MLQRRALRREQLGAVGGDVHVIFQTNAKLAAEVDARFIAEAHAGRKGERVAAHQVGPLMAIHPDPMTEAMGEVRVVWTEAGAVDHLARGRVHRLRFRSEERRVGKESRSRW